MNKLYSIIVFIIVCVVLGACGTSNISTPTDTPTSTNGSWAGGGMTAEVKDGNIKIYFESDDTKALYWSGTFPKTFEDGKVQSDGDTEAMFMSLMGSSDSTKSFALKDSKIIFEVSAMGVTKTVRLERKG